MMPAVDPREVARKKRARFAGIMTAVTVVAATTLSKSHFRGWVWALWLVSFTIITVFTTFSMRQIGPPYFRGRSGGSRPGRRRSDREAGDVAGHSRGDAGPADPTPYQWRMLLLVSRMMPGSAGRRWRAEAESLLSEIAVARRGAAARSYLRSAPRLMVMMWAHELLRLARLGPRRPG